MIRLAPLLLLLACAGRDPVFGTPATAADVQPVVDAWRDLGLPVNPSCAPPRIVVARDAADFYAWCHLPLCGNPRTPGCADSCFREIMPSYVVIGAPYTGKGWVRHELFHWEEWCNGLPIDHSDPRIWARPGGALWKLGG